VPEPTSRWLKKGLFGLIAAPVFLIVILMCALNAQDIDFKWFPLMAEIQLPLFLLLLAFFATGFVVGGLLSRLEK